MHSPTVFHTGMPLSERKISTTESKKSNPSHFIWLILLAFFLFLSPHSDAQISFSQSNLNLNGQGFISNGTSLKFGPDGRLYVLSLNGNVDIFTIEKNGANNYIVIDAEELTQAANIPNHNDDGSSAGGSRQATGLTVAGTASNPVIFVSSSDSRIGGPSGDKNLDTNSGVITRFTWNGSSWEVVDIVRGLPRSEENHSTNGLEFVSVNGTDYLIICSGGFTNAGAPSTNFAWITEYALSGAILSLDLTALNQLPIQTDLTSGRSYIYDVPTLDDPTRPNVNGITDPDDPGYDGIDVGDPWGGNDGLNQGMLLAGEPLQMFSPGYRNTYDLAISPDGKVYATDNGANGGWGGLPMNEGNPVLVNNDYDPSEPGGSGSNPMPDGEYVNNADHLHKITDNISTYDFGTHYAGHPCPVRANPSGAGLFTNPNPTSYNPLTSVFRTQLFDPDGSTPGSTTDPNLGLPANWPPVSLSLANPDEADWRGPGMNNPDGPNDEILFTWGTNTNGLDVYTSSAFDGAMQGDLIAGKNGGVLRRVDYDPSDGSYTLINTFASGLGGNCLGVTCNSDFDPFPGTIWVAPFNGTIVVLEPDGFVLNCFTTADPEYVGTADYDNDGYTNDDEIDNKEDWQTEEEVICNGASQPQDFDKAAGGILISDLNDPDDDSDGIIDAEDPFQLGDPLDAGSDAFQLPVLNNLLSDNPVLKGYLGLGFTGLMNNGDPNPNWLNWLDRRDDPNDPNPNDILGGAIGAMTMQMTSGTALGVANNQEKGFQYGVLVDQSTGGFAVEGGLQNFNDDIQLYGASAPAGGELGIFIGDGFQSNYIKFVINQSGLQILQEINDVPNTPIEVPVATGDRPGNNIQLRFNIDPATGQVVADYRFDNTGSFQHAGTLTAQGSILSAIQNANEPLAVGLIGSSNQIGAEVEGTWSHLYVQSAEPTIVQVMPDVNALAGDPDVLFELDQYFTDDEGDDNLIFTIENNSNPSVGASIAVKTLTITIPGSAAISDITVRATDEDGAFVEQSFTVSVSDEPVPIIRIRANGGALAATDAPNPDWLAPGGTNAQSGSFNGINWSVNTGNASTHNISGRDPGVPEYVPQALFAIERWDPPSDPDLEWTFDLPNGNYLLRLYCGNGYSGTSAPGQRVFDVLVEGQVVVDNLDLSATYGHQVGVMLQFPVTLTDGTLNLSFDGMIENPTMNGIEILQVGGEYKPQIIVENIPDQTNEEGDLVNLVVLASGGTGSPYFYEATNLPAGLQIEPTTGLIFGNISAGASAQSPYNVTITIDQPENDPIVETFIWTVTSGPSPSQALFQITPGAGNINASTFGNGSFQITNNSPTANITSVTIDMSTGFIPNMVFDPFGTAGDIVAKDFQINQGVGGTVTDALSKPLGNGGFQQLDITFDDFNPSETFTFSIDQDPTSIEGLAAPGPGQSGSVSGLEQVGSTITVNFSDGASLVANLYSDGSNGGGMSTARANLPAAPVLSAIGLPSPSTTNTSSQNLQITGGPPNGLVSLLHVEGAFFEDGNDLGQEPFEVNSAISVTRSINISLDSNGDATVPVTLTDSDPEGGYNYFIAAVEDGTVFGLTSNPVIIEYDDQFTPPDPETVLFRVNAGGVLVPATDSPNPDWSADTGNIGAAGNSEYLVSTSPNSSIYAQTAGSAYQGPIDMSDPSLIGTNIPTIPFTTERYDNNAADPPLAYSFPVASGIYEVRLYFMELFSGIDAAGERVFDVSVEGSVPAVFENIDAFARNGALGAFMLSHTLQVTDGSLDLAFIHGVENPAVKAIEILGSSTGSGPNLAPLVTNPGTQSGFDGQVVNLPISANDPDDCGGLSYSASGLPPDLSIDETTGIISGTIDPGTGGTEGAFIEQNGLVVIEMESADNLPGSWQDINSYSTTFSPNVNSPSGAAGGNFIIWQAGQNLSNPGVGTITYQVQITNPGTYQFQWRNQVGNGTETTEHNDTWLRIDADNFYGSKNAGASIVCPNGAPASNSCTGSSPNGSSSGGWFKIYSSGANNWSWNTNTSDNDAHQIFATFDNPGVYLIEVSARSSSHAIDRMIMFLVGSVSSSAAQNLSNPESARSVSGTTAASENSPYDVTVTVTDNCDPALGSDINFQWTVTDTPQTNNAMAFVQVTPGQGIAASTFGNNSFIISNTGDVDITNVTINTTNGFMMDVVFDPVGTAGDSGAKCLTAGNAGNTAAQVGITVPANGGSDFEDCESVFAEPHNGIDNEEGYDELTLDFTDFNGGESFAFGVDVDPTSIKGDLTTGDAGAISGFEMIGSIVTITFANGAVYQTSLFDEGSMGGADAIVNAAAQNLNAPGLSVNGSQNSQIVFDLNQTVVVSGTPNANVSLLQIDGRLHIDPGNPGVGYDLDPFEANEAMAKALFNLTLDGSGFASVPVSLLQTPGSSGTPDGGLNHFIAVETLPTGENSVASNTIVLEYEDAPQAIVNLTVNVQGRTNHSGDYDIKLFQVGQVGVPDYNLTGSADASGTINLSNIVPGTYQVAVKRVGFLQIVETIVLNAGPNTINTGTLPGGDINDDNQISLQDFALLAGVFNTSNVNPGNPTNFSDINGNGFTDLADFAILAGNFGQSGQEPSANP